MNEVHVVLALGLPEDLVAAVRQVSPRLRVTSLSWAQRRVYRGGRPVWYVYAEERRPEEETEEEARANLATILAQAEVLFTSTVIPPDIVGRAPRLRWVQLTAAGVEDLLDSELASARGRIILATASGIHAVPIGEYVMGAMLAFAKGLPAAMRAQAERTWRPYLAEELCGKTVGILGLGAIGGYTAKLAKADGMRVLAIRRSVRRRAAGREAGALDVDELLSPSDLPYLLSQADYVVIAVPLTPESRGLIGERELRTMRPTARLINISRGAVIDEAALVRALKEEWIAGAALDVFQEEPLPPDSELWGMDNVILTPHISGGTPVYMERAVALFCDNLRRYLAGEPLRNVVDLQRGY
ncbi:MAG: D-2-hydroxyacid dehydrogenase [Dehalococcoidia bacterium]|nr:MAG: D-2-hydroxyacid dehydrogenase [Dehalococcoidia bacterium]